MANTYFSYFNLDPAFDIDVVALDSKYLELQSKNHPDKFATKSPQERAQAATETININQAYQTLKSPLKRAVYVLHLKGVEAFNEKQTIQDKGLLMETLEAQERLDQAQTQEDLDQLQQEAGKLYTQLLENLSEAFKTDDLIKAKDQTIRLKYTTKQMDDIRQKKFDLIRKQAS